jgi:hypothetical protein
MASIAAILCLVLISGFFYAAARRRRSMQREPLTRSQIAGRLIALVVAIGVGLLLFPIVWLALFGPYCCNP